MIGNDLVASSSLRSNVDVPVRPIDLRSDTVTLPTPAMYERMRNAPLGDDGLDGDPTVRELEQVTARMLGKEAGLFVPTATMGNLLAVLSQTRRQGQVVLEATAHMFASEHAGATLSGVAYLGIAGSAGAMNIEGLEQALKRPGILRTDLVCMETTHANAGGTVLPLEHMQSVQAAAHATGACVHVDGARLFNAAVALNVLPDAVARHADTVAVCLSKGLSAPAGALLAGPSATIDSTRRLRKILGGTQRQIGIIAAAGLEAIESLTGRLAQDHIHAQRLSIALGGIHPQLRISTPVTNIVLVELPETASDSGVWIAVLAKSGILVRSLGPRRLRLVTHRHIDALCIDTAVESFRRAADVLLAKVARR